jgi:IS5 family transposase
LVNRRLPMFALSFASLTPKKKTIRSEQFLQEMDRIIPWERLVKLIEPHYPKEGNGRKPMDLLLMLRLYCLQQWYNLSDPSMEEAVYDRLSFQRFLRVDLILDRIPDETTILHFRHLLEKNGLTEQIFHHVNAHLQEKGLLMKKGTIVDATIIRSPSSTKNQEQKRDPEMSSTRKNGQYYFGMKVHTGVDAKSGLTHSLIVTTAKDADIKVYPELLHGQEEAIFGDKAYCSDREKHYARDAEVFWGVLDRRKQGKQLSKRQKKKNRLLSGVRSKVEFVFHVIKHLWGHAKTRYRGLDKNRCHWQMLAALANLYQARKKLLEST